MGVLCWHNSTVMVYHAGIILDDPPILVICQPQVCHATLRYFQEGVTSSLSLSSSEKGDSEHQKEGILFGLIDMQW